MPIIWRDDDILMPPHSLGKLMAVDDILQRHGALHTIAIIAETLTEEVAAVIRERGMSAQLHCWSHDDLSVDEVAMAQLPKAVAKIEDMVGVRPTTLYPPWNKVSQRLIKAAKALGLSVSWEKVSLSQYIRFRGSVEEPAVNFHYWHAPDVEQLEVALSIPRP